MRNLSRSFSVFYFILASAAAFANPESATRDPLPSWHDGGVKSKIIAFVERITDESGKDFVPVAERIATFDNDGTLWQEKPLAQAAFILEQIKSLAKKNPSMRLDPTVKAFLNEGLGFLHHITTKELVELLVFAQSNMDQDTFDRKVKAFFEVARHPKFGKPYTELTYQPMIELLNYLTENGFKTFICSGGGVDFMRAVTESIYDIPSERVIGSSFKKRLRTNAQGEMILWRLPAMKTVNDKTEKPINIDLHIGKHPIFTAGNVGGGGDIAMLTYSQGAKRPSFQLLINHDDPVREFQYAEINGASLKAAAKWGWTVVSMKDDWQTIFAVESGAFMDERKTPSCTNSPCQTNHLGAWQGNTARAVR